MLFNKNYIVNFALYYFEYHIGVTHVECLNTFTYLKKKFLDQVFLLQICPEKVIVEYDQQNFGKNISFKPFLWL